MPKIPEEAIACHGTSHDAASEHRKVRLGIVSPTLAELSENVIGPVRAARFVTVRKHVLQALLAHQLGPKRLRILGEIRVEVRFDVGLVELVDLEAGAFARGRM